MGLRLKGVCTAASILVAGAASPCWAGVDGASQRTSGKSAAECNAELERNADALRAAGESASTFFHACWWHSKPGEPTPIASGKAEMTPFEAAPSVDGGSRREASADRATPPLSRTHARRSERGDGRLQAEAQTSRSRRRRAVMTYRGPPPFAEPVADIPLAPPPAAAPLPSRVSLSVPGFGPITVPIVPVPGVAATVREVVDHPVVPGLVSTSP